MSYINGNSTKSGSEMVFSLPDAPAIGVVEWFSIGDYERVEATLDSLKELGVTRLRTGISWADWFTAEGQQWYDWLLPRLAAEVEILPCFLYTPPSIGIEPKTSSPPANLKHYADLLDVIITRYGDFFEYVELWNEPNNKSEWDFTLDNGWFKFCEMIGGAAYWAKHRGKKTVLGGMSPVDPNWLNMMFERGVMQYIDVVGFHGFPDVFDTHWEGWQKNIERIAQVLDRRHSTAKIWITEAGFSTWQYDERKQLQEFCRLLELPLERVYWYSMHDLNPASETVDGFHLDEREYHFGLKTVEGSPKLLYRLWSGKGLPGVLQYHSLIQAPACLPANACEKPVLITGGAGFLGANLAQRLLEAGRSVIILDNLSHKGAEKNVLWLSKLYGNQVQIEVADVRNEYVVKRLVGQAGQVFHLAAQEFTEKSITSPVADFEVNVRGTLNVLEALRGMICPPPLVFTSTSRVYGSLDEIGIVPVGHRYVPMDCTTRKRGINENRPLVFQTPYGCSKGAADQYVMDYSRTYGLPAVVLRPGCVYGAHQFGSDEGGWITGMISSMMENKKVRIYGDGRQVKDLLFIDDMVDALLLAQQYIYELSGQAFNIGGGVSNTASVLEVLRRIEELQERQIKLEWEAWRTGEQRYYASDISKFNAITGWTPRTNYRDGIEQLYQSSVSSQQLSVSS